jgi:3-hydroxybutyryl-CoA dehydrogenase
MTKISTVGVIGAGQMGAGIAQVFATAGYKTLLWDSFPNSLERGIKGIHAQLDKMAEKGKLSTETVTSAKSNLKAANSIKDFAGCNMAIEAIVENIETKLSLFKELDALLPADAYLTSNTSSISITRLAGGTKRPEQVMGVHFMNPVPVMQLVELIRGIQTSDETYNTIKAAVDTLGKTTILGVDSPGFVVNRILCPMINEAIFLLQEGVKAEDIDAGMKLGTNHPMGPLTLADFVGLDTLLSILQILHRELGEDKYRPCPLLIKYVEAGWYGRKVGRGFYRYDQK